MREDERKVALLLEWREEKESGRKGERLGTVKAVEKGKKPQFRDG